jgi:hypothetical protein
MAEIKNQVSFTTNVGGRGGSATPGGYNQGTVVAAIKDASSQGVKNSNKDVRGGTATAGGYNQGDQFAMAGGGGKSIGTHKDLRGGNANSSSGYNQGPTVTASKK